MRKMMMYLLVLPLIILQGHIPAPACELMGASFNEATPVNNLFGAFRYRGNHQPDGWGVAFYPDKSVQLFKEPKHALESGLAEFLTGYESFTARLLIAHVRKASVGGVAYQNTHPFQRELDGTQYVLAHNGTLRDFNEKLPLGRIKPLGINDSEFLLCYLLGRIEKKDVVQWDETTFGWLQDVLRTANETGKLNCLFSNGEYLFVYHDMNDYTSLHYIERAAPFGPVNFLDTQENVDLNRFYSPEAVGTIVATIPLTDEKWVTIKPGQLIVLIDGAAVFTGAAVKPPPEDGGE